jgi:hypothetical protein
VRFLTLGAADHVPILDCYGMVPYTHIVFELEGRLAGSDHSRDYFVIYSGTMPPHYCTHASEHRPKPRVGITKEG